MGLKTSTYVCQRQIQAMCTRESLLYSPSNLYLTYAANISTIVFGMYIPRANRTKLTQAERFPALAYGTLVAVLAGWKGVQRYKNALGGASRSKGQWLLDIFIRQVISAERMMTRAERVVQGLIDILCASCPARARCVDTMVRRRSFLQLRLQYTDLVQAFRTQCSCTISRCS
jgi:hypothetical protein